MHYDLVPPLGKGSEEAISSTLIEVEQAGMSCVRVLELSQAAEAVSGSEEQHLRAAVTQAEAAVARLTDMQKEVLLVVDDLSVTAGIFGEPAALVLVQSCRALVRRFAQQVRCVHLARRGRGLGSSCRWKMV